MQIHRLLFHYLGVDFGTCHLLADHDESIGSRLPPLRYYFLIPLIVLGLALAYALFSTRQDIVVLARCEASTYALAFDAFFKEEKLSRTSGHNLPFKFARHPTISASGSRLTWQLLQEGVLTSGLMQYNAFLALCEQAPRKCGMVAQLYDEHMLTFVRSDDKDMAEGNLSDIAAKFGDNRVLTICCLAPESSQAGEDLKSILIHHQFKRYRIVPANYEEAMKALLEGTVDAAFFVGSPLHPVIQKLGHHPLVRPVEIHATKALAQSCPGLYEQRVEVGTFDLRHQAFTTLVTPCVLVASTKLSKNTVESLLEWLLSKRNAFAQHYHFLNIQRPENQWEDYTHPGAVGNENPFPWIVVIGQIAIVLGFVSASISLATAMANRKKS